MQAMPLVLKSSASSSYQSPSRPMQLQGNSNLTNVSSSQLT